MLIEEYLQDLRRDRFAPRSWVVYVRRVAAHVRAEFDVNPSGLRSIWSVALVFFAADFLAAAALTLLGPRQLASEFFVDTALIIVPTFTFVTLHLDLLRDSSGYRLSALNLPLALTLLRPVLLPGLTLFLLDRQFALALAVFVIAGASDIADGWLARRMRQATRLGQLLDPLVDIVFNLTLFSALALTGMLPPWVAWVAVARYALLLVGGACLYLFVGPVRIQPTLFGRMTGVLMAALVAMLTLLHTVPGPLGDALIPLTSIALGVLLSATVAQVVVLGWHNLRLMRGQHAARGRVVGDVRWGAQ